tara:strand:- start:133 stop:1704 length:1572 start_codon:yes stop_codon:yes gene_type:complete
MKRFSQLLVTLILKTSRNDKISVLSEYFKYTPDPDRGYALGALTRTLSFPGIKPTLLRTLVAEKIDQELFNLSYDYVGDLAETVSLIWPDTTPSKEKLPSITEFISDLEETSKTKLSSLISSFLDNANSDERWAMIKFATGGLRVGVSARLAKTSLAAYSGYLLEDIERVWHGLTPPYIGLFEWLDGKSDIPKIQHTRTFHPMMLANPLNTEKDFDRLDPNDFQAEWKWDGIRVQAVFDESSKRLFSRTGDDISRAFPDIVGELNGKAVLDGELLVGDNFKALPFNHLQQRLNRKSPTKIHLKNYPAFIRVYDMLFYNDDDIRDLPLQVRRQKLEDWMERVRNSRLDISEILVFDNWNRLAELRTEKADTLGHEGVMIKDLQSKYSAGRPKGPWFKWKRDPKFLDGVMMYAQRGHGRRSSFYSDYTFGIWQGNELVPVGKAYSGFTDEELVMLDKWVRGNTLNRFGPVREVRKELVVELAFDSAHESSRHKSGVALRFPRINRIRWDKPAQEADTIETIWSII